MHAESNFGGAAPKATAPAEAPKPAVAKTGQGKAHGRQVSVSFHKEGSVSAKIDWQGRSGRLCRAATPFKFVGMAKLAGTAQLTPSGVTSHGHAEASGKASGGESVAGSCAAPRSHVPATPPPTPVTQPEKPEPVRTKVDGSGIGKGKPVKPTAAEEPKQRVSSQPLGVKPTPPPKATPTPDPTPTPTPTPTPEPTPPVAAGPTPTELEKPQDPPAEPPKNVFGYETPVLGCFEGQVFPLAPNTQKLPDSYASLTPVSVVYACEWDIPERAWDQGFPGVADRFEWFAIRYAGAFHIAEAGDYAFRLSSDDGAKLLIDGKLVVDNDGQHPPKEARGSVQLSPGDHQMVLEYFQGPRFLINLQLWVTPPGKSEELFTVR